MCEEALTCEQRRLMEAARAVAPRAYAPYSRFPVGAAVLGGSGAVYVGVNVENASYPVTLCAERNAVGSALAAGESAVRAVAVAPGDDSVKTVMPCGMCRQFLAEFGLEIEVIVLQGGRWTVQPLAALLPLAFSLGADHGRGICRPGRSEECE